MDRQVTVWQVPSEQERFHSQWGELDWAEWLAEECGRVRFKRIDAYVKTNGGGRMALFVRRQHAKH